MIREIYRTIAYIADANGSLSNLNDYCADFDSKHYSSAKIAYNRAYGMYCDAISAMSKIDTRQLQVAMIIRLSDGSLVAEHQFGALADLPDPEPEPEPEQTT